MSSTRRQVDTALAGPAGEAGGTSVSVMKEQSSHLWGGLQLSSRLWEEARGGRREGTPPSWPFFVEGGAGAAGPSATSCFPVAVAFHSPRPQVPVPLLWFVSNVLYLIGFKHPEMSQADFSWEQVRTYLQSCCGKLNV